MALALFAAIVMAVMDSGSTSSVSSKQPTVAAPASSGSAPARTNDQASVPTDTPLPVAQPTVDDSAPAATDTPPKERPARTPTPAEVVPTRTPVPKVTPPL